MSSQSNIDMCRKKDDDCKRNDYTWFFKKVNKIINNSKNFVCHSHSPGQNMCDIIVSIHGQVKQEFCLLIECHKPEQYNIRKIREIKANIEFTLYDIKYILNKLEEKFYSNKSLSMNNCQSKFNNNSLNYCQNSLFLFRFFVPPYNYTEYIDLLNRLLDGLELMLVK